MLVKLFPEQIAKRWDFIKPAINDSLPPIADVEDSNRMNNILESLLLGSMDCWIDYSKEDKAIKGVVTTKVLFEDSVKSKSLLVYSVYTFGGSVWKDWTSRLNTLSKYAKVSGCDKIVVYTDNDKVVGIFKRLGGESRTFLSYTL